MPTASFTSVTGLLPTTFLQEFNDKALCPAKELIDMLHNL